MIQVILTEESGPELKFEASKTYREAIDCLIAYLEDCKVYGEIKPKTIVFEEIPE